MKTAMNYKKLILFFSIFFSNDSFASAVTPVNLLVPYDTLIRPEYTNQDRFQFSIYGETGFHDATSFNDDGTRINVLRIWNRDQNALAMLKGFDSDSPAGQLLTQINATDNGIRGHFNVCGELHEKFAAAFAARVFFADSWAISAYLPVYNYKLTDVSFQDQTKDITDEDRRVKELLTNNLAENVQRLGCLDLSCWERTGPGDLTLLLEWFHDFYQQKPFLKIVRINWRSGLSIPTGKHQNEDKLFAFSFGNDGAFAIPFGLGLDLTFGKRFKCGFDVELTQVFGNTRLRRIITSTDQTELLLLQKAQAHKDYGLTQRFNLYFQFYRILKGFSLKFGYQFKKHGDDELSLSDNTFSSNIANSAQYLEEWTMHHLETNLNYDFGVNWPEAWVRPQISFYTRLPFNGKNSATIPAIGAILSFDF